MLDMVISGPSTLVTAGIPIAGIVMSVVVSGLVTWFGFRHQRAMAVDAHHHQRAMAAQERRIDLYLDLLRAGTLSDRVYLEMTRGGVAYTREFLERYHNLSVRMRAFASPEVRDLWEKLVENRLATDVEREAVVDPSYEDTAGVPPEHEGAIRALSDKAWDAYGRLAAQIREELGTAD